MSHDEFKMLIDLMGAMTEAGKWAFIWWLIMSKLTVFIASMTVIVFAYIILRGTVKNCQLSNENDKLKTEMEFAKWREIMDIKAKQEAAEAAARG